MMMGDETAAEYHVDFDEGILVRHGVELEDNGGRSVPVEGHLRDIDKVTMVSETRLKGLHRESVGWRKGVVAWGIQIDGRRRGRAVRDMDVSPFGTILPPKKGVGEAVLDRDRAQEGTGITGMI